MPAIKVEQYLPLRDTKSITRQMITENRLSYSVKDYNRGYFNGTSAALNQKRLQIQNGFIPPIPELESCKILAERFSPFIVETTRLIRDDIAEHLTNAVKFLAAHGLSQRMLASRLNLDPSVFSRVKRDADGEGQTNSFRVPIEALPELAYKYLGCSVAELLLGSNEAIPLHVSRDVQLLIDSYNRLNDQDKEECERYLNVLHEEQEKDDKENPEDKNQKINRIAFERLYQIGDDMSSKLLTLGYLSGSTQSKNRLIRVMADKKISIYLNTFLFICFQFEISPDILLVQDYSSLDVLIRTNPYCGQEKIWNYRNEIIPEEAEADSKWRVIEEHERKILSYYLRLNQDRQNRVLTYIISKVV